MRQEHSSPAKTPADVTATGNTTDTPTITVTVPATAMKKESIITTGTNIMYTAPADATDSASNRGTCPPLFFGVQDLLQ